LGISGSARHLAVFGFSAVSFGFVFLAEVCPVPFFLGGCGFSSVLLELVDQADCFEEVVLYSLLVYCESFEGSWALEVVVDYGSELDFRVANWGAGWVGHGGGDSGVESDVESGVVRTGIAFVVCQAGEYDSCVGERVFGVFVLQA